MRAPSQIVLACWWWCDDPQFNLDEDDEKVVYAEDEKVENAIEIVLLKEDHTLGNLIRMQLHTNDNVLFSGYKGKATYHAPPPPPHNTSPSLSPFR